MIVENRDRNNQERMVFNIHDSFDGLSETEERSLLHWQGLSEFESVNHLKMYMAQQAEEIRQLRAAAGGEEERRRNRQDELLLAAEEVQMEKAAQRGKNMEEERRNRQDELLAEQVRTETAAQRGKKMEEERWREAEARAPTSRALIIPDPESCGLYDLHDPICIDSLFSNVRELKLLLQQELPIRVPTSDVTLSPFDHPFENLPPALSDGRALSGDQQLAMKIRSQTGYVFISPVKESLDRMLFGAPSEELGQMALKISPQTLIFLVADGGFSLHGVFVSTSRAGKNLDREAFRNKARKGQARFRAQVWVRRTLTLQAKLAQRVLAGPISASRTSELLRMLGYYEKHPPPQPKLQRGGLLAAASNEQREEEEEETKQEETRIEETRIASKEEEGDLQHEDAPVGTKEQNHHEVIRLNHKRNMDNDSETSATATHDNDDCALWCVPYGDSCMHSDLILFLSKQCATLRFRAPKSLSRPVWPRANMRDVPLPIGEAGMSLMFTVSSYIVGD
jgi:hypothetical protein